MTKLHELYERFGQSPWLDNLKRQFLTSGELERQVKAGIRGVTSNPTIFQKAIENASDYDAQFTELLREEDADSAYWDLVLTDIVMPDGVTGRELADRLRAQQPDLKVIFTSGYTMNLTHSGAELREGVNFLQKPYPIRALAKVVRDCLDRKS